MTTLTLYYRNDCHLCEDMWQLLQSMREERMFDIQLQDIDTDPALKSRFGTLIPVLAAGEQVICNYYLDPVALNRYLDQLPDG